MFEHPNASNTSVWLSPLRQSHVVMSGHWQKQFAEHAEALLAMPCTVRSHIFVQNILGKNTWIVFRSQCQVTCITNFSTTLLIMMC